MRRYGTCDRATCDRTNGVHHARQAERSCAERLGGYDARSLVDREAFVSDDIYRLEIERIFNRTWIFLAHESEIPAAGDYVTRILGRAPVVVVRGKDGAIHALLNSCRHRGTMICRADAGNIRHFVCPYHGWSYERDGRLITTTFDRHLPKAIDFSELGLIPVPRLETTTGCSSDPGIRM